MRLSEAIRLGAMLSSQARGTFFRTRKGEEQTCALGAAADAVGTRGAGLFLSFTTWPILHLTVPDHEVPSELRTRSRRGLNQSLMWVIMALNDNAGWTRTQIADWVEEFERHHATEMAGEGIQSFSDFADFDEPDEDMPVLCVR